MDGGGFLAKRLPRVAYPGGPFLRHPRIITITFKGDDPEIVSTLERFGDTVIRTAWWREVTDGYCASVTDCVGSGRPGFGVRLDHALPAGVRDTDIETLLAREGKAGRFGPLDADTLLIAYLPEGVSLADAFVPRYCGRGPRAYHRALRVGWAKVAYAVVPRCGDEAALTVSASHEIVEATTNPDPSKRGFAFEQHSANLGFTAAGIEPVDPCGVITMDAHREPETGFVVQRAWSNRAASLGRDPCVPTPAGRPYIALVPRQPTVRLAREGASTTIVLDAATDQPAPAWTVSAFDLTGYQNGQQYVQVSLDKSLVAPGDTANLSITVRKHTATRLCVVGIVSTLGGHSHVWPVAVVMR